jgi:hypothetical protein
VTRDLFPLILGALLGFFHKVEQGVQQALGIPGLFQQWLKALLSVNGLD